ncbi:hypothetical protein CH333_01725 [candidate division WOR-3 bacterium JGI_Cruoil_03_44_89]|mgnify:CR=1 FL=1|uniref:DUF2442 domain-containing protein n=1 Tax=candidate division WOR-3 bacterium JGI_Cruoil_03_44_89 TaxID=1973748 RepID=A0A235BXU8_UNCW3|nr:MAG: hypothetical protein CH333_01725 [candidate division WOR-3 bacterium JGI_Cruoil_03_44_89]
MNTSAVIKPITVFATDVRFSNEVIQVYLSDGRVVSVPIEWFPALRDATEEQRNKWRLIGRGVGIHWEEIDEDLFVDGLLKH